MSGYASNQFWNFGSTYEKGKTLARQQYDNPNFIWPRPNQPDVYNPLIGKQTVDTRLQRGFIRGIYPTLLGGANNPSAAEVKQRRLFFQFNPETIDRSVEMNAMVANPLLQDPSQIFQPVAGTAAFSFQLLFNREAEVVSARNATNRTNNGAWVTDTANPLTGSLDTYGENTAYGDVASLGVLADLYVLDSIIGQSITPDMKNFIKSYFNTASNATQAYNSTVGGPSAATFDATGFETNITKNYGNGAFLSPLPVRIVFSSLFMVEGFVETSSVRFAKFSSNYVPTVCAVNLNIRALYIGFAKDESYLTSALTVAVKDMQAQQAQDSIAVANAKSFSETGIKFTYTTPTFKKTYKEDNGTVVANAMVGAFDTPQDWWNAGIWPAGDTKPSGGSNMTAYPVSGSAEVTSYVTPAFAKAVTDGKMTWTVDTTFKIEEVDATSKAIITTLFEGPLQYLRLRAGEAAISNNLLTNAEIAENAVKATTPETARKNKYTVDIPQSTYRYMSSATNLMRFTITNTIKITVQQSAGSNVVTNVVSDYVDISKVGVAGAVDNSLVSLVAGQITLNLSKKEGYGIRMGGPNQ